MSTRLPLLLPLLLLGSLAGVAAAPAARAGGPTAPADARCQQTLDLVRPVYETSRANDLRAGRRPSPKAGLFVRFVERACEGLTATEAFPDVGATCEELVEPGEPLPATALAHCLRAEIEGRVQAGAAGPPRPNIVLVLADDARRETVDVMPRVQRLAEEGIHFRRAFVTTALCTPSRASVYTGLYARHHGSRVNEQESFEDDETIATWLSAAGYTTGFFGKYRNDTVRGEHVPPGWDEWRAFTDPPGEAPACPRGGGLRCYFDYTLNENGRLVSYGSREGDYSTDRLAHLALDFVRESRDRPFFLLLAPVAPHYPAIPAPRHAGSLADLAPFRPPGFGPRPPGQVPPWMGFLSSHFGPQVIDAIDARRIAELESMRAVDEAVGALVDELEAQGVADQTLFVFSSDQGIHWGEQGWINKGVAYEPSIRVPLVARYPALAPTPRSVDEMVLNLDLAPTFAELAGAATAAVDGESWLRLVEPAGEGGTSPWRDRFVVENPQGLIVRQNLALRTERWKYILTSTTSGQPFEELYDLETDPHEVSNLARRPEHQIVRALLARSLLEQLSN